MASFQQVDPDSYAGAINALLEFLDSSAATVPGNVIEDVVTGKRLLRALSKGELELVVRVEEKAPGDNPRKPTRKKKAAKT